MTDRTTNATALAKLRHLYQNMVNGGVRDTASAKRIAEGLLAPAIAALESQALEMEGLRAARWAYASEFPPDDDGEPDVGSIHQNIRALKAETEARERLFWEACSSYGKAGEAIYMTYKTKRDAAMAAKGGES